MPSLRQLFPALVYFCLVPLSILAVPPKGTVVINEVVIDSRGSSRTDMEFIELHAKPGTNLGGLSVITVVAVPVPEEKLVPGSVVRRFDLPPSAVTNAAGMYLIANRFTAEGYKVRPDLEFGEEQRLTNEPQVILLLPTAIAPEPGSFAPSFVRERDVYDTVGLQDLESAPTARFVFKPPLIGPDQTYLAAGAMRLRDGVDTNDLSDWILADIELPPNCYNTPGRPNRQGGQAVVAQASGVVGTGATAPTQPASSTGGQKWLSFSSAALEQAVEQNGSALIYVRAGTYPACKRFEQNYLLKKETAAILAGRPTFFLDVNQPGQGRLAQQLGVYRVPTLYFRRKNQPATFLSITPKSNMAEVEAFLRQK